MVALGGRIGAKWGLEAQTPPQRVLLWGLGGWGLPMGVWPGEDC